MLLALTIVRVALKGIMGCVGLWLMIVFVQHQPNAQAGMIYIQFFATPMMALVCGLLSAMAIGDYLHTEQE